jgi:cytoskeletal protein CcmA (bactofilin family)
MPKERTSDGQAVGAPTVIGEDAVLEGTLQSTAPVHISGAFKGRIIAENELVITASGRVEAKVKARRAVVAGQFTGDMIVLEDIEIAPTCRFLGTLTQNEPGLIVAKGGRFEGRSLYVEDLEKAEAGW